jgi:4-hydroxy-tetrahydrodipicolinate synthase
MSHYCNSLPMSTACSLSDETVARLVEIPQFIGLKDATGDVTRPALLRSLVGSNFRLFSGDDATALAFLVQGGNGCISVTSNVAPGLCRCLFLALSQGQTLRADRLASPISRLTSALFRETNPVPLKYALSLFDLMSPRVRLPLVELTAQTKTELAAIIEVMCDEYSGCMIGKACGEMREGHRAVAA